jgi:hypothetical protein
MVFRTNRCANSTTTGRSHSWGENSTLAVIPRLTAGGTPASSAWDGKIDKRAELALSGERVRVRGCSGVQVCMKARACAHRHQDRNDGHNGGGDTASGQTNRGTKKEWNDEQDARAAEMAVTPARRGIPAWQEG